MKIIKSLQALIRQPGPVSGIIFICANYLNSVLGTTNGVSTKEMIITLFLVYLITVILAGWHLIYSIILLFLKRWQDCRMSVQAFILTLVFQTLGLRIDSSLLYIT